MYLPPLAQKEKEIAAKLKHTSHCKTVIMSFDASNLSLVIKTIVTILSLAMLYAESWTIFKIPAKNILVKY